MASMFEQDLQPVADERGAADRSRDLAALDEIALLHPEHEVTGGRIDLAAGERLGVEALGRVGDDLLRRVLSRAEVGVGHARIGQVR